jgi:hypothetical protein
VLEDPRCRRQIEQALNEQPAGFLERAAGWMRRPRAWALAGTLATAVVIAIVAIRTEQQPRVEVQLAQRQKVEAPALAPAPPAPPPAVKSKRRAPASGGVVGGVLPAAPPAPGGKDAAVAGLEARSTGEPVQLQVRQDAWAPAPGEVRYDVLVKGPDGEFVEADRQAPVAPGTPVRLVLTANERGNLAVFDETRNLLFRTNAIAGGRYTVDPPLAARKFTIVLAPAVSAVSALRKSEESEKPSSGAAITVIDLTRPRN